MLYDITTKPPETIHTHTLLAHGESAVSYNVAMPYERIIPLDESNRAKRRSVVSQDELKTKALPRIGKGPSLIEQATFDPNAEDGDGDGLVQDNTPFERPALLKPIVDAARGLASGTGSPVRESTRGKTNRQIAEEAVSASTPEEFKRDVIAQKLAMGIAPDSDKIASLERNIDRILDSASFSPEDRAFVVDAVEKALDASPEFREIVDLFGMPPVYAIKGDEEGLLGAYLASVPAIGIRANQSAFDRPIGEYEFTGAYDDDDPSFLDILGKYLPVPGRRKYSPERSPEKTVVHEYAHHLSTLGWLNHPSAEKRDAFFALYAGSWGIDDPGKFPSEELGGLRELLAYARSFTEGGRLQAPGDEVPMVESAYGLSSPAEFWAEGFMAYLSPDPEVRAAINQPMRDLIEALLPTSTHLGKGDNYKPAPTTGNTMSWMSPSEIADAVVPKNADQARKMLVGHWRQLATESQREYSDERILGIIEAELKSYFGENATVESVFAFDYGSQQKLREMVEKSLSDRPELLAAVRKFGMPPIVTTTPEVQKAWGKKSAGIAATAMADHLPMIMINPELHDDYLNGIRAPEEMQFGGFERFFARVFRQVGIDGTGGRVIVSTSPEGLLAHEWGHYIAKVAAWGHPDGDVRELARFYFAASWSDAEEMGASLGGTLEQRTQDLSGYVRTIKKGGKPDPDAPFVLTRYGQTSPAETFAEGIAALVSPNRKDRDLVSPALKEDINRILGRPSTESEPRSSWLGSTTTQERGMKSSFRPVRRREDGTREFRDNTSPLRDGPSWLRDASNEEIADAVVAHSLDDAAVLMTQFIAYGEGPKTPEETRALKAFAKWYLQYGADRTTYDFSPETRAKMRGIVKQALDESPEFAWFVRNYGMPPVLAISKDTPAEVALKVPQMLTGDPSRTATINAMHSNENIMGMTFGNMMIVINQNSPSIRDNAPSGFIPAGRRHMTGRIQQTNPMTGEIDTFIPNMGKSGADVLRHEWGHWFYFSFLGTPAMYGGRKGALETIRDMEGGPNPPWQRTTRNRNDRAAWYAAATGRSTSEILDSATYLKSVFEGSRLWWSSDPGELQGVLARLEELKIIGYDTSTRKFVPGTILDPTASTPENRALGATIIGYLNSTLRIGFTPNGEATITISKWTPDFASQMTTSIETLIKNLLGRAGEPGPPIPRISGMYAGTNPAEILAESFAVFTSPDPTLKERYLSDDIVEAIARLFNLPTSGSRDSSSRKQGRPEVGGIKIVSPPWEQRGTPEPERTRADVLATLPQRTMTPLESLTSKERIGSSEVAITVERGDAGNFTFTEPDGRQWTVNMGENPRDSFEPAYDSWVSNNHSQIRNASAEIMAMERPETRTDPIPADHAHALAILDDVSNSKTFSSVPGYRVVGRVLDTDDLLAVEVGESIDMPLSSFNPDESDAKLAISQSSGGALGKTVIVRLAAGARVSEPDESYEVSVKKENGNIIKTRAEMITQGRFKVTNRTEEDGHVVVDIDHVSTFDPLSGEMSDLPQWRVRGVRYPRNPPPQQDSRNEVPSGREIGGFRSAAPIRDRARDLGVSLDAYDSEENDIDDIEWSSNDWSFSKTGPVQAGDAVIVRDGENGKEVLMISRKNGPFREALALPGGLRDEDETLYDSADREMFEEVGISVGQTRVRKPLGEIEARDWDPRFAAGGVIGGVLYEVEPDVRAEAADDARGLQWISLEELSRGDQAIAFGHASWLAEAFRSDPVLGPRFALLAEASRIRNHRLIEKINERRAAAGVQQFPELPDPNSPYVTIDSGLGRGRKSPERGMRSSSTRSAFGLDRTNPDEILEKFDRELEPINTEIRKEKDFAQRLARTIETLRETGEWRGADNDVYINEGNAPRNLSKDEIEDVKEVINAAENALFGRRDRLKKLREQRDSIKDRRQKASERLSDNTGSDNTIDIEEILSNPELVNELRSIAKQVSEIPYGERSQVWTAPDGSRYVIHFGAARLEGGVLDPDRSRGVSSDEGGRALGGNTREANRIAVSGQISQIEQRIRGLEDDLEAYEELLSGRVNLNAEQRRPVFRNGEQVNIRLDLITRGGLYDVEAHRTAVSTDGVYVVPDISPDLAQRLKDNIAQQRQYLEEQNRKLAPLLRARDDHDYQHISAYPAEALNFPFGDYGGRYSDTDADRTQFSDFSGSDRSDEVGVHIVRVKPGDDVFDSGIGGEERGIIGRQKPVASIIVPRDREKEFQELFPAIVARSIESDIERMGKDESASPIDSIKEKARGFASRNDAVDPVGKTSEEVAQELELTQNEKDILNDALPNYDGILNAVFNPSITEEQKKKIFEGIRVRVGDDNIPFITMEPHPLFSDEIPDKRDWSVVMAPSKETQGKIRDLLERIGVKLKVEQNARSEMDERYIKMRDEFAQWALDLWDSIAERNPIPEGSTAPPSGDVDSAISGYMSTLFDLSASEIRERFGSSIELAAHDLWGHYATGRGFDRHGEYANMLAMFSMMDRWAEEKGIPKSDVLRLKSRWFQHLEQTRLSGRFMRPRDEPSPIDSREWWERETGVWDGMSGFASDEDLEELVSLLDDGNVHEAPSRGFASMSRDERVQVALSDLVRQSRVDDEVERRVKDQIASPIESVKEKMRGFASRNDAVNPVGKTSEEIAQELELTPEEKDALSTVLPDYDQLKELVVNPAITPEQKQEIIDSVRVRVDDGVTYITTDPNPLVIDEIPDKRDWSTVVAPSRERQEEIRDLLERIGERVDVTDRETADQVEAKTKLNTVAFSEWLMKKWRAIGDKNSVPVEHLGTGVYGGGFVPTGFTIYFLSLYDLNASNLLDYFGDADFLNAHDLWGHAAIGRGFDRHGEWANMLAMFSLMDKWAEDNNISESDVLKMKSSWFRDLEYVRFDSGRFMRGRDETSPNSTREWYDREVGISDALGGMATDEEIKELIGLLDHGRVHDSSSSKGFASITKDERVQVALSDIVRQLRVEDEVERRGMGSEERGMASASPKKRAKNTTEVFSPKADPRPAPSTNAELVARAVPTSREQLRDLLKDSPYVSGKRIRSVMKKLDRMEIDWEKQELLAQKLQKIVDESPAVAELLREYDIPPMFITNYGINRGGMDFTFMSETESWFGVMGQYFPGLGSIAFPEHIATGENPYIGRQRTSEEIIVHELAHSIHAMAVQMSKRAKKAMERDIIESMNDDGEYEMIDADKEAAGRISSYAQTNRLEYIAETLLNLIYPAGSYLDGEHYDMLSEFLDIPVSRLKELERMRRF